ncbi:MAG: hypothetical protein ACSLE2_00250 [Lysobacterales bacterium]
MPYRLPPPSMNPLSRILASLLAVLAVVGAFFFGLVVLALAVGLGLLAWLGLVLRMWWLRRRLGGTKDDVIEADYEVVSRRKDP